MTVTEGQISVTGQGNAGVVLDTTVVEQVDGSLAHREGVFIGDPEITAARVKVVGAEPSGNDFGAVVRDPAAAASTALLLSILAELRVIAGLLQEGLNVPGDLFAERRDAERHLTGSA